MQYDKMGQKQRSSIEIMTQILEVAVENHRQSLQTDGGAPVSKRELMRSANLNYNQLTNYIETLDQKGFIMYEDTDQGLYIEVTDDGLSFFDRAQDVTSML